MQFFLYEILARVVATYFCFACSRTLWSGLVERRITLSVGIDSILDYLLPAPRSWTFERDAAPVEYWITVGLRIVGVLACMAVAILGWFHPDS